MPIQNGKYINPGWVNGGPPAIDNAELNAISNTLEKLDAGGGTGGGGGKRYARFVIGTSTAGWTAADCDYLCDGTADQETFLTAINALPSDGGEIKVLDGTYNFSDDLILFPTGGTYNLSIVGSGWTTVISGDQIGYNTYSSGTKTTISLSQLKLSNMSTYCNGVGGTISIQDCFIENSYINGGGYATLVVLGCYIVANTSGSSGFSASGTFRDIYSIFSGNRFEMSDEASLYGFLNIDGGIISSNTFQVEGQASSTDILLLSYGTATGNTLVNCGMIVSSEAEASSNYVKNGSITAADQSSAIGNIVQNGQVQGTNGAVISGNNIYQESPVGDCCIEIYRGADNKAEDTYSIVSNNICRGGAIGILLSTPITQNKNKSNACIIGNSCTSTTPLQVNSNWSDCLITGNMFPNGPIIDNGTGNIKANNFTGS